MFVGGGTAGHVNPALAVAQYLKKNVQDVDILYVGSQKGIECDLVRAAGFKFQSITITGFSRKLSLQSLRKNLVTIKNILVSIRQSKEIISEFKPDLCFGTGGYVCGPLLYMATKLKIPYIIHEQNAYPGLTTRLLARNARKILIGNKSAYKYIKQKEKIIFTNNPIRREFCDLSQGEAKKILNLGIRPTILSFGGSLGAQKINEVMAAFISKNHDRFNFIHATGNNPQYFFDIFEKNGLDYKNYSNLKFYKYIKNMPVCMAACDLLICRSGALTLAEICESEKPSILIPSPNVTENHQFHNAMELVNLGIADIIEEKDFNLDTLSKKINNFFDNPEIKNKLLENFKKLPKNKATEVISKIIIQEVNRNRFLK